MSGVRCAPPNPIAASGRRSTRQTQPSTTTPSAAKGNSRKEMKPINPMGFSLASTRPAYCRTAVRLMTVDATKAIPRKGTRAPQGCQPFAGSTAERARADI